MSEPALAIRPANLEDLRFVRASWFESYRMGGFTPQVAFPIYRKGQDAIIESCLQRSQTFVAYATYVPDEVCSWVCLHDNLFHFIYTKLIYRRKGIARSLLRQVVSKPLEFHTHDTRVGRSFTAKVGTKLDPYSLYNLGAKK